MILMFIGVATNWTLVGCSWHTKARSCRSCGNDDGSGHPLEAPNRAAPDIMPANAIGKRRSYSQLSD